MPRMHIPIKVPKSFGLMTFLSIIIEGRERVVTPIIKASTVPSSAPFKRRDSAIGIVPKISAYMGIPTRVARITPAGFPFPSKEIIQFSGIQL